MIAPALGPRDVHVWRIDLARDAGGDACLDAAERGRAARFVFDRDRVRFVRAHVAMRRILGAYLGRAPADLAFGAEEHGKPVLEGVPDLGFNLSHSADAALLALGRPARIGIDLEARSARYDVHPLARSVFTPAEVAGLAGLEGDELEGAFLRGWTRKEACLKALGVGLTLEPASFHAGLEADRRQVTLAAAGEPVEVETLPEVGGAVAAVAVAGGYARAEAYEWRP